MNDVVAMSVMLPYSYLIPWWIVRRDMQRLPPAQLARCWNSASFGAAVVAFAPFCIVVHFIKAHGWRKGSLLGCLWTLIWFVGAFLLSGVLESFA